MGARRDRPPPQIRRVAVAPDVELEVLDWHGRGAPLVFLPGLGDTGHAFGTFAPRFRDAYHVYAITPRGFGASSRPADGYDSGTRARDIVAVLDSLGVRRAVLVGHSIAGDELSRVAVDYPERVRALLYLDAYSYGTDYDLAASLPTPRARAAFRWPAADSAIRARVLAGTRRAEYGRIGAAALAIYALDASVRQIYPAFDTFDVEDRRRAAVNFAALQRFQAAQIRRFRAEVRRGEVREIPEAHHYVFLSHPDPAEHAMWAFLGR